MIPDGIRMIRGEEVAFGTEFEEEDKALWRERVKAPFSRDNPSLEYICDITVLLFFSQYIVCILTNFGEKSKGKNPPSPVLEQVLRGIFKICMNIQILVLRFGYFV